MLLEETPAGNCRGFSLIDRAWSSKEREQRRGLALQHRSLLEKHDLLI
jgi:hypothetical protein